VARFGRKRWNNGVRKKGPNSNWRKKTGEYIGRGRSQGDLTLPKQKRRKIFKDRQQTKKALSIVLRVKGKRTG